MSGIVVLSLSALLALLPAALLALRGHARRDALYWSFLAAATAGTLVVAVDHIARGSLSSLSSALWVSIAATLVVFVAISALTRQGFRLAPLLLPYVILVGIVATVAEHFPGRPMSSAAPAAWLDLHVLVSVLTYGLLTNAAVAGIAVFLQERALKRRAATSLTAMLPAVAEAELLQIRLLVATAVVLGLGLITGAAIQYVISGNPIVINHKTLFALLAFAAILAMLAAHYRTGVRGRRAARVVLLAWLLLTLAYPGVKFVTDVLIA